MGTSTLTRRSTHLVDAKITFGRLQDGCIRFVQDEVAIFVPNRDHPNIVVGTRIRTGRTPNTRGVVDDHLPLQGTTVNSACGTADHADRVGAMHARIGNHDIAVSASMPGKTWIVVMRRRASAHTIVATHTTVRIDHHGCAPINDPVFN